MSLIIASSPIVLVFYSWTPKVIRFHFHSLPCRATLPIIFIFQYFSLYFVRDLQFVQCIINLIFYNVYLLFIAIQYYPSSHFWCSKSPLLTQESSFSTHSISSLRLSVTKGMWCLSFHYWWSNFHKHSLLFTGRNSSVRFLSPWNLWTKILFLYSVLFLISLPPYFFFCLLFLQWGKTSIFPQ